MNIIKFLYEFSMKIRKERKERREFDVRKDLFGRNILYRVFVYSLRFQFRWNPRWIFV